MTAGEDRHLSVGSFAGHLRAAVPIDLVVPGTPRLVLFIDPERARIGLRGRATAHEQPPTQELENLTVRTVHRDQARMIEIAVTNPSLFTDAYPLLCAVADRVQLHGQPMTDAMTHTLRRLGHLLQAEGTLPREVEIGLLGELCVLARLVRVVGPGAALDAWRDTDAEEHDFGLADLDVEVKTTTSEKRTHWISSLTQLVPTGGRALWLVSFQVTGGGTGGSRLGELVAAARGRFSSMPDRERFDNRLGTAGWRERYAQTCRQRWRLRTPPASFAVADGFPRLTPTLLIDAGIDMTHISDVRYRLDLTGRSDDPAPDILRTILATEDLELV
jgi:hypothetical protein